MKFLVTAFLFPLCIFSQKIFVNNAQVSFFSAAPLEDISAVSNQLDGVVDIETGDFFFRIPINTFIFPSSLMQKHFNEKYMESEKYSMSLFKGSFDESVAILDDSLMNVSAAGVLNIHGVEQDVIIDTDLNIYNGDVLFYSEFNVPLKDYKIKIPKVVRMNIADTILVKVSGRLVVK
ncbi:MAG: hypothetical protein CMP56_04845 [Flavobacteriales bacterium]|nr:hypothetical protein [Flavobacteriales bacterium]|tara:strand:+ start:13 stop:543 length:531 start_codon:yes stop_codon:yes gene_type:complete